MCGIQFPIISPGVSNIPIEKMWKVGLPLPKVPQLPTGWASIGDHICPLQSLCPLSLHQHPDQGVGPGHLEQKTDLVTLSLGGRFTIVRRKGPRTLGAWREEKQVR